jgi:hypothetical protein
MRNRAYNPIHDAPSTKGDAKRASRVESYSILSASARWHAVHVCQPMMPLWAQHRIATKGGIDKFVYRRFNRTCSYRRRASLEPRNGGAPTAASARTDLVRSDLAWSLGHGGTGLCSPMPTARPSAANKTCSALLPHQRGALPPYSTGVPVTRTRYALASENLVLEYSSSS